MKTNVKSPRKSVLPKFVLTLLEIILAAVLLDIMILEIDVKVLLFFPSLLLKKTC